MLLIGHRGASGYEPENTLNAFHKAIVMNCDGIELDAQLSKDNELVIIHDETLERTTTGNGYVKEKDLNELQALEAGIWCGKLYSGYAIPTLASILSTIPKNLLINVEIKGESDASWTLEKKLLELIYQYDVLENVLISSFDHRILRNIRMLDEHVRIGVLLKEAIEDLSSYLDQFQFNAYSIHPPTEIVDAQFVESLKGKGYKIFPYTVNEKNQASRFMELGIDGIITDYPDVLD